MHCMLQWLLILDIDECSEGIHDCQEDTICVNEFDGYSCQCQNGYQLIDGICKRKDCQFDCLIDIKLLLVLADINVMLCRFRFTCFVCIYNVHMHVCVHYSSNVLLNFYAV